MAENNTESFEGTGEILHYDFYDNSSRHLIRHVYVNSEGEYDHDVADFIFKKAGYTRTYIVVHTTGIPDGVILNLCDENSNQLYSPVDTNKNWTTTACSIIVGETDIIPLPAQFNNQLSNHVPFPVGTYNWKLVFAGNDYYEKKELPLIVLIRDFKVWDIQTPTIYPNENVKAKIQTNANTLYPPTYDMSFFLTNDATYDYETGVITYPNQDITDLSIGKHMQVINPSNNCFIDYEVKNPFEIRYVNTPREYSTNDQFILLASFQSVYNESYHRYLHAVETRPDIYVNGSSLSALKNLGDSNGEGKTYAGTKFPPGTYNIEATAKYLPNHLYYTATKTMIVTTDNCELKMGYNYDDELIYTIYVYNNTTPIPNATIELIDIENNTTIETKTTNNDGMIIWSNQNVKNYKSRAIDTDNTNLLESEPLYLTD